MDSEPEARKTNPRRLGDKKKEMTMSSEAWILVSIAPSLRVRTSQLKTNPTSETRPRNPAVTCADLSRRAYGFEELGKVFEGTSKDCPED